MDKYTQRLIKEWQSHGKIILSVDFDSTIYPYHTLDNQDDINRAIKLVQLSKSIGAYIVIFTASNNDRHQFIQEYCDSIKVPVDAINTTPIEIPNGFGKEGKIYYNHNLCDRSGLVQAMDILDEAINYMLNQATQQPYTT